jgi:hypothetical protein
VLLMGGIVVLATVSPLVGLLMVILSPIASLYASRLVEAP